MTVDRAKELIAVQVQFKSGYNRNAVRLLLAEVTKHHGQKVVDGLITEFNLEELFGLKVGTEFHF
jgi:hypothetical protein